MKEDELAKALLKQDGLDAPAVPEAAVEEFRRRVAAAKVRVRRMKRLAVATWVWSAVGLAILIPCLAILKSGAVTWASPPTLRWLLFGAIYLGDTAILTLPVASAFTVSYLVRSRSAGILEINARLMRLEEQIARLTGPQS